MPTAPIASAMSQITAEAPPHSIKLPSINQMRQRLQHLFSFLKREPTVPEACALLIIGTLPVHWIYLLHHPQRLSELKIYLDEVRHTLVYYFNLI